MLSKCANPACEAKFRYLHEGKVYLADWVARPEAKSDNACWRRTEMYWLCDRCSGKFVLSKDGNSVVPVKPGAISTPALLLREIRISR